ncbi:MAG: hypothetical protein EXR63_01590 [Dehalococcoidia bacterium]|nr:hypothetical protein [Dehalococcoidia bacterium]
MIADRPKPRSTWRVLLVLVLALALGVTAVGACVAAYVGSAPERTVEVPIAELEPGRPRFFPLPVFGADASGQTHGVWVVRFAPGGGREDVVFAFDGRAPGSGCGLEWRALLQVGAETGAFRDRCSAGVYNIFGAGLIAPDAPDLKRYRTVLSRETATVHIGLTEAGPFLLTPTPRATVIPAP